MNRRKLIVLAGAVCLSTVFAAASFAGNVTVVSRETSDRDFSRNYTVTLDESSVKKCGSYYTAQAASVSEIKETFKPGETRETKREDRFLYAFHKTERKYKILDETSFESSKLSGSSYSQQSSQGSSSSVRTRGIDDWQQLPADKEDCLNKLYDKTMEIAAKKKR